MQEPHTAPIDTLGTVGGDVLEVTIADTPFGLTLDELHAAHGRLAPAFA